MDKTTLLAYTAERLKQGATLESIKQNLLSVGWTEEEAGEAIVAGLIASGVPVPPTGARKGNGRLSSTVEVVLNFFSFIVLVMVATALGILYYQIINNFFSDPLTAMNGGGVDTGAVHYAIAVLLIGFPIYVLALNLWFIPPPAGVKPAAWHLFAIFAATIFGVIAKPLPSAAASCAKIYESTDRRLEGFTPFTPAASIQICQSSSAV